MVEYCPISARDQSRLHQFGNRELQGESGESQQTDTADDAEARADLWSIQGDFICRHHNEPRSQLYVP